MVSYLAVLKDVRLLIFDPLSQNLKKTRRTVYSVKSKGNFIFSKRSKITFHQYGRFRNNLFCQVFLFVLFSFSFCSFSVTESPTVRNRDVGIIARARDCMGQGEMSVITEKCPYYGGEMSVTTEKCPYYGGGKRRLPNDSSGSSFYHTKSIV